MYKLSRSILTALAVALSVGGIALQQASAAAIDLSNTPVAGTGQAPPKPNVMLLMDTSKSMAFTHMPDALEDPEQYVLSVGYRSAQCNSLYYDPAKKYVLPKDSTQLDLAIPNFGGALYNYYSPSTAKDITVVDLSVAFRAYDRNTRQTSIAGSAEDPAQPAYYYVYTDANAASKATLLPDMKLASPCADLQSNLFPAGTDFTTSSQSATTVGAGWNGRWTRKAVNAVSGTGPAGADERQNFAIWYTYYRTRMAMVKSSISTAFAPLTEKFRIGFISMNPLVNSANASSGVAAAKYLPIFDFNSPQKAAWYTKVNDQVPFESSPAREGLARVGRHYAGKFDGINNNMTPDPVTNSCQQNFTIMTTDGYWNTAGESPGGGPVGLDGITKVGNTDGLLTLQGDLNRDDPMQYSHRPMWDGAYTGKRTDTNRFQQQRYLGCDSGEFYRTVTYPQFQTTSQPVQRTQSLTKRTAQISMSTAQTLKSTTQTTQTTQTQTFQTLQNLASTQLTTLSTRQERRQLSWYGNGSTSTYKSTTQALQTTNYMQLETTTRMSETKQTLEVSSRQQIKITQALASTKIARQTTVQNVETETIFTKSTTQPTQTTTQNFIKTTRQFERTSQLVAYSATTEQSTPVASCTNSANITCLTLKTGPTAVASCTAQSPTLANNYLARTCDSPTVVGPTPTASCTGAAAGSGNNFTLTECTSSVVGPTAVGSCATASPIASNNYVATACSANTTGPTDISACAAGTVGTVTTTCTSRVVATKPVQTCSARTSGTSAFTCTKPTATNVANAAVASCAASAGTSPNWITTTCPTATTTGPTGVASCSYIAPTSPTFKETTCSDGSVDWAGTDSCTPASPTSGNSFKTIQCRVDTTAAASAAVQTCAAQTPTATNLYLKKVCTPNNTAPVPDAACLDIAPTALNGWKSTICTNPTTTPKTAVFANACTPGWSGAQFTTCTPFVETDTPVSVCTPNTTGPTYVACRNVVTGPVIAACTPGGGSNTNWVFTTCTAGPVVPEAPVQACTTGTTSTGGVTSTCTLHTQIENIAPNSCVGQSPTLQNGWVTISCIAALTTSAPRPLNSCTTVAATAPNWVATTCSTPAPTVPAPVQSCVSGDNSTTFVRTTCTTNNSAVTQIVPGSCTSSAATSNNQWTQTVCPLTSATIPVVAGSCAAVTPTSQNGFKSVVCTPVNTGPTPVALNSCSPGVDNNQVTTTCSNPTTGPTLVASCTPGVATDGTLMVTSCSIARTGPTALPFGPKPANEPATAANSYIATAYAWSDDSVGVPAGSCVPSAAGVNPIITCPTVTTSSTPVASCDRGTDANFVTTSCSTAAPAVTDRVMGCTVVAPSVGNGFVGTSCLSIKGNKVQTNTQTTTGTYTVSGSTIIPGSATAITSSESGWTDSYGGMCYVDNLPSIPSTPGWLQATTGMPSGCSAWPCSSDVDKSASYAGSLNSLADVAQYYYTTDLRTSAAGVTPDPWKNDVPKLGSGIEDDRAPWQHMTTFVLGLGVSGTLNYKDDYRSSNTGDFARIRSYADADMGFNWPVWPTKDPMDNALSYSDPRSIDDFWHTAVNGRGKFFSAKDPDSVVQGLREALAGIEAQAGAGAGAATSSLTPTAGDNSAYTASFTTSQWTGDLQAREINLTTGNISTSVRWSARDKLDLMVGAACDNRTIYTKDPNSNTLADFSWNTKSCATNAVTDGMPSGLRSYFNNAAVFGSATPSVAWSQYSTMSDPQRTAASNGANLVNFLRGQRANEGYFANDVAKLYRTRVHVLGDIVGSQPLYVKAPSLAYQDTGYATFKTNNASRKSMVYAGANDGMLHAFYAPSDFTDPTAGKEAWAYVPTAVISNLYKLADNSYSEKHIFTVDGAPIAGDVYDSGTSTWKTMLVGGLNAGGKGYYALDITNPALPKSLWEFNVSTACNGATSDCNLGLTFGRPVITKLKSGKWVVLVTSGYNNTDGDGKGYLYVLDANTGAVISRIGTGVGSSTDPSGLRELNYFVSNVAYDNTALRAYGTDIKGNVWRFDINDTIAPGGIESMLIATTKDKDGKPQPIVTRPELAEVSGYTMVMVGTGKLLASDDLTDQSVQSVYAIKDPMNSVAPGYVDLRASLKPLKMTQTGVGTTRTRSVVCASGSAIDCSSANGWFIDLPDGGERVNIDMQSVLGTLVFASNVPNNTICVAGGYSWLNYVNLINGEAVSGTDGVVSVPFFENTVVVGLGLIGIGGGTGTGSGNGTGGSGGTGGTGGTGTGGGSGIIAVGTGADGTIKGGNVPVANPPPVGKRISWREITQ